MGSLNKEGGNIVGHLFFLILHFLAVMFGLVLLVVTIPLHLIYSNSRASANSTRRQEKAAKKQAKLNEPDPRTHLKCPDCREFVLREASVCKHCGCELVPKEAIVN